MATTACAQQPLPYSFRHITQQDGLLHNQVFSIAQDGKGYIWVITPNGLQRYDGSRFILYPEMLSDPLEGLAVTNEMYADKSSNQLWILKKTVIEKIEPGRNSFTVYDASAQYRENTSHFVAYHDTSHNTWLMGKNIVCLQDNKTKRILSQQQNIMPPGTLQASYVSPDRNNQQVWVATLSSLFLFDENTKMVYSPAFNPIRHPLITQLSNNRGPNATRYVMTDSRSNVWVITWGDKLYRYDPLSGKVSTYLLSDTRSKELNRKTSSAGLLINCMMEDDHQVIWVGTENAGLLRFNREKDNFDYCISTGERTGDIQYNFKIFSLLQDKDQNIWIGTDKGINIFNPYHQYFSRIRHDEHGEASIPNSEIISFIQASNSDLFLGTWGNGMAIYDRDLSFKKNVLFTGAAENNFIWSFEQFSPTTLWIGCQHGHLIEFDIQTGKFKTSQPPELEGYTIRCMAKYKNGNILLGLENGKIITWDKESNKFLPFGNDQRKALPVLNIFIDPGQRCWAATDEGLKEFDAVKRIFIHSWLPLRNDSTSISGKSILGIESFDNNTLLISTINGGINYFNKSTGSFVRPPKQSWQTIYAVRRDSAGYIWYTTDYGLAKIDPVGKKVIPYNLEAGTITSSFRSPRFYPLQNGQWLTLTNTEAISFNPREMGSGEQASPVVEITGLKIFDRPIFIDSILSADRTLRLSYKENFFTIEFAALDFSELQQTHYSYHLQGTDKDWVNAGTRRFASYTDLQPGTYNFEVKAETGNRTGAPTRFSIVIRPPFWKSTLFRLMVLLLLMIIVAIMIQWRINSIRSEGKRKMDFTRQISEMEMNALRSQMNPHFIFNCINSIDGLIQSNDKYHATLYLNKFARLLRNILDSNKHNTVTFSKDINTLKLYVELEELRYENKFTTEFNIQPELLSSDYKVPPLIVQPFVENAILHGLKNREENGGLLLIEVTKEEDKIRYLITDNGIGREAATRLTHNKESHYGMQISYDRIKLFNREEKPSVEITDLYSNGTPAGTQVKVLLNIV